MGNAESSRQDSGVGGEGPGSTDNVLLEVAPSQGGLTGRTSSYLKDPEVAAALKTYAAKEHEEQSSNLGLEGEERLMDTKPTALAPLKELLGRKPLGRAPSTQEDPEVKEALVQSVAEKNEEQTSNQGEEKHMGKKLKELLGRKPLVKASSACEELEEAGGALEQCVAEEREERTSYTGSQGEGKRSGKKLKELFGMKLTGKASPSFDEVEVKEALVQSVAEECEEQTSNQGEGKRSGKKLKELFGKKPKGKTSASCEGFEMEGALAQSVAEECEEQTSNQGEGKRAGKKLKELFGKKPMGKAFPSSDELEVEGAPVQSVTEEREEQTSNQGEGKRAGKKLKELFGKKLTGKASPSCEELEVEEALVQSVMEGCEEQSYTSYSYTGSQGEGKLKGRKLKDLLGKKPKVPGLTEVPAPSDQTSLELSPSAKAVERSLGPSPRPFIGTLLSGGKQTGSAEAPDQSLNHEGHHNSLAVDEGVEARIQAAAQMREEWIANLLANASQNEDQANKSVDAVLDGTEKLVKFVRNACSKRKQQDQEIVDVQSLQLRKRTPLEQRFALYSALCQVLVDLAGSAIESMPFGAPAAAVLGAVYTRAAQAARLSHNCEMLLDLMKSVDAQLARVMDSLASKGMKAPQSVETALQELLMLLIHGGRLMKDYAQRGFIMRFILSTSDTTSFAALDEGIHRAMGATAFCVSMDLLVKPANYQPDESASLRAAVCTAAGLPEDKAERAVCQLSRSQPGRLRELIQEHGNNFSVQVLAAELDAIAERMEVLEEQMHVVQGDVRVVQENVKVVGSRVTYLEQQLARSASRQENHMQLASYLKEWWTQAIGKRAMSVPVDTFFYKLVKWFKDHGMFDQLLEYEEELQNHGPSVVLVASKEICEEEGGRVLYFLSLVVLPLLDANADDWIDRTELLGLQVTAEEFARRLGEAKPTALLDLLDIIFQGFSLDAVKKKAIFTANTPDIAIVSQALKVTPIIQSYGVHMLLESHTHGTRQWLFDRVNKWLETALSAGRSAASLNHHRMFLLLAGPGMGKSVFSAVMEKKLVVHMQTGQKLVQVRHFFKVGEPRAQGKSMVLCLAQQLAEQLPGMAALLRPVVEEHGCAELLSMKGTLDKFLLEPLTALDKNSKTEPLVVVMLLDAIDEAADGATGYESVASLVGYQMAKLPFWVKIILTGRPQMESCFAAWSPEWIEPSAQENMLDMSMVLEARLQQGNYVSAADTAAAVKVMLRKSQGQFIFVKFALDQLSTKEGHWTPAELEAALPSGLHGVFRHVMGVLQGALQGDQPATLALLRDKLLPILLAAKSPLSPQQLATMAGAEQPQVDLLLNLLTNMFPTRLVSGKLVVVPYHKSVLDWLAVDPHFAVDARLGHECLGKACSAAVIASVASPSGSVRETAGPKGSSGQSSGCILSYALRFGVTHLCLATDGCVERLEDLVLNFSGFWPMAFEQGCGADLLKDLVALGPKTSAVVRDVVRWLKLTSNYLTLYPRAALQLACDSPHNSLVARHANSLPEKPQARLLTKQQDWHACLITLQGHESDVLSVAVSADTIVSGSHDATVRVWDLQSGACKATLSGHTQWVKCVAISPDARLCVSGSADKTVRVWDLQSGACKATLTAHTGAVTSVAISLDGCLCVSGSWDETVRIWEVQSGVCMATLQGHTGWITSISISQDSCFCVAGSSDKTISVWELQNKDKIGTLTGHTQRVESVAIQDASLCVSGSADKTVRVWDLRSQGCVAKFEGHTNRVMGVALSQDASFCVSCSLDETVRVWDRQTKACKATLAGHTGPVNGIAISQQDACLCVSGSGDKTVRVWDFQDIASQAQLFAGHTGVVTSVSVSPDASFCVSGSDDKGVRVWDLQTGACKALLSGHTHRVTSIAISPDGSFCVSGSDDMKVRVWDLKSRTCKSTLTGHTSRISCVAISLAPDACLCVSGSLDKTVRVWDLQNRGSCKATLTGHSENVTNIAISADARLCVSGSDDETARVWDLRNSTRKATLSGHTENVTSIAISRDARLCVSGSWDGTVRVWDLEKVDKLLLFRPCKATLRQGSGHTLVESVALSPDNRFCIVGSSDKKVRKWDMSKRKQLACFDKYSTDGAQLRAVAESWRAGNPSGAAGDSANNNVVAWAGKSGHVIHWHKATSSHADDDQPTAYLMPPMRIDERFGFGPDKYGVFYEKSSNSVSFFDAVGYQFVRYQLLA